MKIYCAVDDAGIVKGFYDKTGIKMNFLFSYFYAKGVAYKMVHEYRHMIDSLCLDSGAYSAMTLNKKITINEYLLYLKNFGGRFDAYFNLDDDFDDPNHNDINQRILEEGLPSGAKKPIPVIHDQDAFKEFEYYAKLGHDYIAIGSKPALSDAVFDKIQNTYPNVKIHMFGNLNRKMLKKHLPYSADSTSWAGVAATGEILYWDEDNKKECQLHLGGKNISSKMIVLYKEFKYRDKVDDFLKKTFDFDYSDLLAKKSSIKRQIVNIYFFKQLQDYYTSLQVSALPTKTIATTPKK